MSRRSRWGSVVRAGQDVEAIVGTARPARVELASAGLVERWSLPGPISPRRRSSPRHHLRSEKLAEGSLRAQPE